MTSLKQEAEDKCLNHANASVSFSLWELGAAFATIPFLKLARRAAAPRSLPALPSGGTSERLSAGDPGFLRGGHRRPQMGDCILESTLEKLGG